MNIDELKAAAGRYSVLATIPGDENRLADFACLLLRDAPVTADWLRETWGFRLNGDIWKSEKNDAGMVAEYGVHSRGLYVSVAVINILKVCSNPTQGQATMLFLGLGLTPRKDGHSP